VVLQDPLVCAISPIRPHLFRAQDMDTSTRPVQDFRSSLVMDRIHAVLVSERFRAFQVPDSKVWPSSGPLLAS